MKCFNRSTMFFLFLALGFGAGGAWGGGNPADPFRESPGVLEFSGRMTVRPVQLEEWILQGLSPESAQENVQAARDLLHTYQQLAYVSETDETILAVPAGSDENQLSLQLMGTGLFGYAEPDWLAYPLACPGDPDFSSQWYHVNMDSCAGWDLHTGFPSVGITFCDTGILTSHEDLQLHRREGYHAIDMKWESDGGDISPVHPHGTLVTGCSAGNGDNCIGLAGVGWNLSHRMMRVSDSPSGSSFLSVLTHGARTGIDAGDRVASVSYSGCTALTVQTTGTYIKSKNGLLFWAAGNAATELTTNDRDDDDVMIVGATTSTDAKSGFSNFGQYVDIMAPGSAIYTTDSGGGYASVSGTSFACPIAAGLAGLIWSVQPDLSPDTVELLIKVSCDDLGASGIDNTFAYGRINIASALGLTVGSPGANPPSSMTGWWPMEASDPMGEIVLNHPTSPIGSAPTWVGGKVGDAMSFGGSNALVVGTGGPWLNIYSRFSADAWVRTAPCETITPILDKRDFSLSKLRGYRLYLDSGRLAISLAATGGSGETAYISSGPDLRDSCWHLVAATVNRSEKKIRLYVDSKLIAEFSTVGQSGTLVNSAPLLIGGGYPLSGSLPTDYFFGQLDEVEIFRKELTQEEIAEIYAAGRFGKRDFGCDLPSLSFCGAAIPFGSPKFKIHNFATTPTAGRLFEWEIEGEFDSIPINFTPSSGGPVLVPAGSSLSIPFDIDYPTSMVVGDVAEYTLTVNVFGSPDKVVCKGTIIKAGWIFKPIATLLKYDGTGEVMLGGSYVGQGTGSLDYQVSVRNEAGLPDESIRLNGQAPGVPLDLSLQLDSGRTAQLGVSLTLDGPERLRASRIVVEADIDGDGLPDCLSSEALPTPKPGLQMVHARGLGNSDSAYSGFIDPRVLGGAGSVSDRVTVVFNRPVFDLGSTGGGAIPGHLTTAGFEVTQTGSGSAPRVQSIHTVDQQTVEVVFDRQITAGEWTTLIARVEDASGREIDGLGDLGPGQDELDRIDIAALPGDTNQDGRVSGADRDYLNLLLAGVLQPASGRSSDWDLNRDGTLDVQDEATLLEILSELRLKRSPRGSRVSGVRRVGGGSVLAGTEVQLLSGRRMNSPRP